MWDHVGAIADAVFAAPFGIVLAIVSSFVGWTLFGTLGAGFGMIVGLVGGLWLDYSNSNAAKTLRLPISVAAVLALIIALFR